MFDIGIGETIAIAIIGLLVIGPDRLPQYAARAARGLRDLKLFVDKARADLKDTVNLGDLGVSDLKSVMDVSDQDIGSKNKNSRNVEDIT